MIPRLATETLVTSALRLYNDSRWLRDTTCPAYILDAGTGSGCILVSLQKLIPAAIGVGFDISTDALAVAEKNSLNILGLDDAKSRTSFQHHSFDAMSSLLVWDSTAKTEPPFDFIVCNPPYCSYKRTSDGAMTTTLDDSVVHYEPHLALFGGPDGLACYESLAAQIATAARDPKRRLHSCRDVTHVARTCDCLVTFLILEVGSKRSRDVEKIFESHMGVFELKERVRDQQALIRCLIYSIH
jgi:release factor glutamine methyltransferase